MIENFPDEFVFEQKMLMDRSAYRFWFENVCDPSGKIVNWIIGYVEVKVANEEDKTLFLNYDGKQYAVVFASDQNIYMVASYLVSETAYLNALSDIDTLHFYYQALPPKILFDIIEVDS